MSAPGKRKSEQLAALKPAPVVPAEAEADDSGRARKSARSRGVSVKLTGAGSCKQQEAAEPGSGGAEDQISTKPCLMAKWISSALVRRPRVSII